MSSVEACWDFGPISFVCLFETMSLFPVKRDLEDYAQKDSDCFPLVS
jgi:hypothetical protein